MHLPSCDNRSIMVILPVDSPTSSQFSSYYVPVTQQMTRYYSSITTYCLLRELVPYYLRATDVLHASNVTKYVLCHR